MILLCGLALARANSAGVAGTAVLEQPNAIVHDWVKRLDRGLYAVFGPVREAEWAPDWSPRFIHLAQGVQHEGVVFTTASGHGRIGSGCSRHTTLGTVRWSSSHDANVHG
jgi:hypothetical protein